MPTLQVVQFLSNCFSGAVELSANGRKLYISRAKELNSLMNALLHDLRQSAEESQAAFLQSKQLHRNIQMAGSLSEEVEQALFEVEEEVPEALIPQATEHAIATYAGLVQFNSNLIAELEGGQGQVPKRAIIALVKLWNVFHPESKISKEAFIEEN